MNRQRQQSSLNTTWETCSYTPGEVGRGKVGALPGHSKDQAGAPLCRLTPRRAHLLPLSSPPPAQHPWGRQEKVSCANQ